MPKVLLVEDDHDRKELYQRYLSVDYDVIAFDNSIEALEFYKINFKLCQDELLSEKQKIKLVLADTRLDNQPRIKEIRYKEGIKLLKDILEFDQDAKVIIMSTVTENKEPAMANGALTFIDKDKIDMTYFKKVLDDYL